MNDEHDAATQLRPPTKLDYSLTGEESKRAIERGLAEADWYQSPVPHAGMRKLLDRRDGPAIRDTILWFALLGLTGWATIALSIAMQSGVPFFSSSFRISSAPGL